MDAHTLQWLQIMTDKPPEVVPHSKQLQDLFLCHEGQLSAIFLNIPGVICMTDPFITFHLTPVNPDPTTEPISDAILEIQDMIANVLACHSPSIPQRPNTILLK